MKKKNFLKWITLAAALPALSFASTIRVTDIKTAAVAPGRARLDISFNEKPGYFFRMQADPYGVILFIQGSLASRRITDAGHQIIRSVEILSESVFESRVAILFNGTPDVQVDDRDNCISVHISNFQSRSSNVSASLAQRSQAPQPAGMASTQSMAGPFRISRVVIDPGHGGFDPGASHGGVHEKDINLAVALKVEQILRQDGRIQTDLTRRGDYYVTLQERTLTAHQMGADLFISIHCNASPSSSARGVETYTCSIKASNQAAARVARLENEVMNKEIASQTGHSAVDIEDILFQFERTLYWEESRVIGKQLQNALVAASGFDDRGMHWGPFVVLKTMRMPSVLIELGYLSNRAERRLLQTEAVQWKMARGIARALGVQ